MFYDLDIDYARVLRMLKDAGCHGYLSIEFEGKAPPATGIPAQVQLLEEALRTA